MEDVDIQRRIFLPLLNLNKILKNWTPGKVAYIWHIERVQIDAMKFERTQIHFFYRRFHGRRRPCLRPLLTYRGLFPYGNLSITDGLFNSKDANLHYNSSLCIEDNGSVPLVSGVFVTVFRVFFAKPSKCEWSHPSQVFLCLGLTFSWTVTRLKPSGVRCWRTLELWGPFCGLVFSLGITKVLFLQSPILNIDIAPTIVELAGGKAPESMDGRSILPLLVCSFEPLFTFFFLLVLLLLSFGVV